MLICLESLHPINIKIHTCILALRLRMAARRVCFHLITAMAHREARGIIACAICSNISQKNYPVNVHSESAPARHTWRYMLISHVCSGAADGKATTNGGGLSAPLAIYLHILIILTAPGFNPHNKAPVVRGKL